MLVGYENWCSYNSFYCVDIDHDNENEIVILTGELMGSVYFDFVDGETIEFLLPGIIQDEVLNQKGFFQKIDYLGEDVTYFSGYDIISNDTLVFDYGICSKNGESISRDSCEMLINDYVAEPAVKYEFTEENILLYVNVVPNKITQMELKLISDEAIEESINALSDMQKAVLGEISICDSNDGSMKRIPDLPGYSENVEFTYMDLDGDNVKEVILYLDKLTILYEIEECIYMSEVSFEEVHSTTLFETGYFWSLKGISTIEIWFVKGFTPEEVIKEYICYNVDDKYYVDTESGESVVLSDEEYNELLLEYIADKAESHYLNYDNVKNIIS